jgi:branched-subunit amino acid ABC-type transport system permease component
MDLSIAAILAQDGITTGAIYALLALALVLVFSVTRVIFIPQGEFVSYGALTLAALQSQKFPATCWLLMALGAACFVVETAGLVRHPERRAHAARTLVILAAKYLLFPVAVYAVTHGLFAQPLPMLAQIALTLLIVIPMGPFVYRLAFEPIAEGTTLLLLIVAVAVHFAMVGLGLVMFGAEGSRTNAFSDATFNLGSLSISGQSVWVVGTAVVLRPLDLGQGVARDFGQPSWGAAGRHRHDPGGQACVHAGCGARSAVRHPRCAPHHHLLRLGLPDRFKGLCGGHHWRPGQLPAGGCGLGAGGPAGIVFVVLGECL